MVSVLLYEHTHSIFHEHLLNLAQVTDSTVSTFNTLGAKKKAALMTALFDPVNGIGFNLMRHTIGASDLSSVPYSYDNQTAPDPQLKNFNLLQQGRDMAKLISQMKAISTGLKLLGSVWSPPGLCYVGFEKVEALLTCCQDG